jgi:hypothetical protein
MFAGNAARDLVARNLNSIGNTLNLEANAHYRYDKLQWEIEAKEDGQMVRI